METIKDGEQQISKDETLSSITVNRMAYLFFMMTGLVYFIKKDFSNTFIYLGIALIFDPFDQKMRWDDRPIYQRIWLYVQLSIVVFLFFYK